MKLSKYTYTATVFAVLGFTLGLISCEPEFDTPLDEVAIETQSSGTADFSNYVAVGNSLTAGFADNALFTDGQQNAYASLLAKQMQAAGGGKFDIPFMADNVGGFVDLSFGPRLVFDAAAGTSVRLDAESTTSISTKLSGSFNNMGIPGALSFHLFVPGYGNPVDVNANPYFVRIASSPEALWMEDILSQQPTFFSYWLGNNDILDFARSGGTGDAAITETDTFKNAVELALMQLSANGTRPGVVANIPDISSIPFFTTVANNALTLDAQQAASLTGFFQAYSAIVSIVEQLKGLPKAQADILSSQYAFTFLPGPNRFLIKTEVSSTNPKGIRQMTAKELLLLTIDQNALRNQGYGSVAITPEVLQVLGKLQTGSMPTQEEGDLVLAAVKAIDDADALDNEELASITEANITFNAIIVQTAAAFNLPVVDVKAVLQELQGGIDIGGSTLISSLGLTSAFSLDGIHLNPRGNAELTNRFINVINETYGATLQKLAPGNFKTITLK